MFLFSKITVQRKKALARAIQSKRHRTVNYSENRSDEVEVYCLPNDKTEEALLDAYEECK